jgi:hypothetical protein
LVELTLSDKFTRSALVESGDYIAALQNENRNGAKYGSSRKCVVYSRTDRSVSRGGWTDACMGVGEVVLLAVHNRTLELADRGGAASGRIRARALARYVGMEMMSMPTTLSWRAGPTAMD